MSEPVPTPQALPVASAAETVRELRRLARPHTSTALLAAAVLVAATSAALAGPWLLGSIVDVVIDRRGAGELNRVLVLLALATVGQGVLAGLGLRLIGSLGAARGGRRPRPGTPPRRGGAPRHR
jgi:ATP-binding cassette subfamily C protein